MIARNIIFKGRVQGVGFRYTARAIAQRFKLTGFVRNLPDGSVEMLAQGPDADVQACVEEINRYFEGYIRRTDTQEVPHNPGYADFEIAF